MVIERNFIKIETPIGTFTNIFENISIVKSLDNFSGVFTFSTTPESSEKLFAVNVNDPCIIYIDDKQVMTGYIEMKTTEITNDKRTLTFQGQEKTGDLVMSALDLANYKTPISLYNIVKNTCIDCGFEVVNKSYKQRFGDNTIKIINKIGDITYTNQDIQRSFGENAFSFISKYANKRQVLLTTNNEGNIVITRRGNDNSKTNINILETKGVHNSQSIFKVENIKNRFNKYVIKSQLGGEITGASAINEQKGVSFDDIIRKTKINHHLSNTTQDIRSAGESAKWVTNIQKARSLDYTQEVYGFHQDEDKKILWNINQIVKIQDDETLTYDEFLIKQIQFNQSLQKGSTTTINFTFKDAYEL